MKEGKVKDCIVALENQDHIGKANCFLVLVTVNIAAPKVALTYGCILFQSFYLFVSFYLSILHAASTVNLL